MGTNFAALLGLELTLAKHWALALDIASTHTLKTRFKGVTKDAVGNHKLGYSLSLAPAIEYNFNGNIGIIAGVWLTAFGDNTPDFINGVVAINIYI